MRLHHVQVACPRGGEAEVRRFYADGLGLVEVAKPERLAGRGGAWFRAYDGDRTTLELHVGVEEPFSPARKAHPAIHVGDVASLDATATRLEGLGYAVDHTDRDTFPGYVRLHCFDPHGNRVELLADPAP